MWAVLAAGTLTKEEIGTRYGACQTDSQNWILRLSRSYLKSVQSAREIENTGNPQHSITVTQIITNSGLEWR